MAREGKKKRFNFITEYLKRRDIFGHQISLNFDNENPTHNTGFGGVATVVIYCLLLTLVLSKAVRVVGYGNPDLNTIK
jgi:hypothetical protein